jgi:Galactose oxidase, central domain
MKCFLNHRTSRKTFTTLLLCGLVTAHLRPHSRSAWAGDGAAEPATGHCLEAGSLATGRFAATATTLRDGHILIAGGYSFASRETLATAEIYVPGKGFEPTGSLHLDRNFAAAALLYDGTVLIAGGFRQQFGTTTSVERYDPRTGRFQPAGHLTLGRELFTATRLRDGRVLLAGGFSTALNRTWNNADIYDPRSGRIRRAKGKMQEDRFGHDAVLLPDGRVLIAGGKRLKGDIGRSSAEVFDPLTETFAPTAGPMATDRDRLTLTLLKRPDGPPTHVLVAGGKSSDPVLGRTAELYDLATRTFTPVGTLLTDRMAHTATQLRDGRVLLVGGWSASENSTTRHTELYDPTTRRFLPAGDLATSRHDHITALLPDGSVLVAGGKQAEPGKTGSPRDAERFVLGAGRDREGTAGRPGAPTFQNPSAISVGQAVSRPSDVPNRHGRQADSLPH